MFDIAGIYRSAVAAHQAGRLDEAEQVTRAVLKADAKHSGAWHLLGLIARQRGGLKASIQCFEQAVSLTPSNGNYKADLGATLDAVGQSAAALPILEQALALEPSSFMARLALGNVLKGLDRMDEALAAYQQALTLQPSNASVHNNLGIVYQALDRLEEAAASYRQAVTLNPQHARAYFNLGMALKGLDRYPEAAESFRTALSFLPDLLEARVNLGIVLRHQGQLEDAIQHLRQAVNSNPNDTHAVEVFANGLGDLAALYKSQDRLDRAVELLLEAVEKSPKNYRLRNNLCNALKDVGRAQEAEAHIREAVALAPHVPETHFNLGNILQALERREEAIAAFKAAIALRPDYADAHLNLGLIYNALGDHAQALKGIDVALRADPTSAKLINGRGVFLQALFREDEALACFQEAVSRAPDFADAQRNYAITLLAHGNFREGWKTYEWRWKCEGIQEHWRDHSLPQWQGQIEEGGKVLVWGEQGLGDKVLYASMLPDLLASGVRVTALVSTRLVPLFSRSFPELEILKIEEGESDPQIGNASRWHIPVASLGQFFRPDAASFPNRVSYLVADAERRARYREYLDAAGQRGPIVGISWGSGNPKIGAHKTLNLMEWAPILKTPGVRFVDLQYGETAVERAMIEAEFGITFHHIPDLDLRMDIDGVAALIAACDLVISTSNTTAHLAGALGKPTWVMVPRGNGNLWYWMRGTETPWYKTAIIFRQTSPHYWRDIVENIAARLKAFVSGSAA